MDYTGRFGWAVELDEIEPGPARTPRWLNRIHWAVADLVQAGILEKSSGSDDLRPTEMGKGLIALAAPFGDTPQTRELLAAVAAARTDPVLNAAASAALASFQWTASPACPCRTTRLAAAARTTSAGGWNGALPTWGVTALAPHAVTPSIVKRTAAVNQR